LRTEEEIHMTEPFLSDEVALRIALASRALQNVPLPKLIDALQTCLGEDLDEAALSRIKVADLKAAFGGSYNLDGEEDGSERWRIDDMNAFKEAVRILWGKAAGDDPDVVGIPSVDMPHSVRVAVASNGHETLNAHFGSASSYLVYQVSASEIRLVDSRSAAEADSSSDKNAFRVNLIRDCRVLYIVSIGGPASAKVIKADIHLISIPDGGPARDILKDLQRVIATNPPPWLAKVLGAAEGERVKLYRAADQP
jgi:nitrogen fixation protein NifX